MDTSLLKTQLIAERAQLTQQATRFGQHWSAEEPPKDWEDLATHRENDEVVMALGTMAQQRIAEIDTALARMESGNWGICSHCGATISLQRLAALPTVTTCIACADKT